MGNTGAMSTIRRPLGWVSALLIATASIVVPAGVSPVAPALAAGGLGAGGEFFPLTPTRIYDSRPESAVNEPAPGAKTANGAAPTFDIALLGQGGVPADASRVLAVVVNITVTAPTGNGWLSAFGAGARPSTPTSIINFVRNQTVPNLAMVRPGADGRLSIQLFSSAAGGATAHVIVDVFGWIATSANPDRGSRLVPVTPGRVLDTRDTGGPIGAGQARDLTVRGLNAGGVAVPDGSDIVGAVLNITGINNTAASLDTYVSVVPDPLGGGRATTSNLNLTRGVVKSNLVIVPVNAGDGRVRIYNNSGSVNVAVDVVGYLQRRTDDTRGGRIVPLSSPFRVFDTREAAFGNLELGPGQAEPWSFADFASSVNIGGVSVGNQAAVIGNFTSASLRRQSASVAVSSYLSVYPDQMPVGSRPSASNVNTVENMPVPNLAVVKYGSANTAWVYNLAGYAHYLFDASAVVLAD